MSDCYYLTHDKRVVECDITMYGNQIKAMTLTNSKHVKDETIDGKRISTVWLGLCHQYGEGPPLVFETMVFHGECGVEEYMERYSTYAEAEAGHQRAVEWVKNGCKEEDRK